MVESEKDFLIGQSRQMSRAAISVVTFLNIFFLYQKRKKKVLYIIFTKIIVIFSIQRHTCMFTHILYSL